MKELEIIELQKETDNECLYMQKVGMFYQAYDHGAFALARLMKYKVKKHLRKHGGVVYVAGFPLSNLEQVILKMNDAGWTCKICRDDASLISFRGADGTPDQALVAEEAVEHTSPEAAALETEVRKEPRYAVHLYETLLKDLPKKDKLKLVLLLTASVCAEE